MFSFLFQLIFIVALPAVFVGSTTVLAWARIGKPWLFVLLGLAILYPTYVAIFYLLPSESVGYMLVETGRGQVGPKSYGVADLLSDLNPLYIGVCIRPLLAFTVLAIPMLRLLVNWVAGRNSHETPAKSVSSLGP